MKSYMIRFLSLGAVLWCLSLHSYGDVVINEVYYNPPDDGLDSGTVREFIELYNPATQAVDLSGYQFTDGLTFTFPKGTSLAGEAYLILVKDITQRVWRNRSIYGPYQGSLSDNGEKITLKRSDGSVVESFKYFDHFPWPLGTDGYASSLERISWNLPAEDYHSWRSSKVYEGTPGAKNSVDGMPPYPLTTGVDITPKHPKSTDVVQVQVGLDHPDLIQSVSLQCETLTQPEPNETAIDINTNWKIFKGLSSPSAGFDWTTISFDDSSWQVAKSGFGYGDLDKVNTILSDMKGKYSSLYMRRKFNLSSEDLLKKFVLQMSFDDGFVAYINGKEIVRNSVPDDYTYQSLATASNESDSVSVFNIPSDVLIAGTNVLAIVGFNNSLANSSDFVMIPLLFAEGKASGLFTLPMLAAESTLSSATYQAVVPSVASQNLVRMNIRVTNKDGKMVQLPNEYEPNPFISYFVYDGELESRLPILWILPNKTSGLLTNNRAVSGVVAIKAGNASPNVYDGAMLVPSASDRRKIKFMKDNYFDGDRTINISPEIPTGGTNAGISSPYREQLGYWFYKEMGVPTLWGEFYRIIALPVTTKPSHTQNLVYEQMNESFLEKNHLNPDADLYKLVYSRPNWEKHTNKDTGDDNLNELLQAVSTTDAKKLREAIDKYLIVDEFIAYSAASIFTSNWDGYWNNNWSYLDPDTKKWQMFPWDLDWCWGSTPPANYGEMYAKMPLSFPIDGYATGHPDVSRDRGPVTSPIHQEPQFYKDYVEKIRREMSRSFAKEKLFGKMDELQAMLLDDLKLINQQTGRNVTSRTQQIKESYDILKQYVEERRAYLQTVLPTGVDEWSLF